MKKIQLSFSIIASLLIFISCDKGEIKTAVEGSEISFRVDGDAIKVDVMTKASEVTGVSSVYWEAKQSGSVKHAVASYAVSGGAVNTGKYWPLGATYDYMVSNVAFTTSTGAISATNATDIVVGTASGVSSNSCTVTLNHIFARTAALTLNTQSGYTLSNVSRKIKSSGSASGTAGTYTIGTGWGATATTALSEQAITSSSDLYLIPGKYTVTVSYTLTKGDYVQSFTKSSDVTLQAGKKNSITGTAVGGNATAIQFNVSVAAWETCSVAMTLS